MHQYIFESYHFTWWLVNRRLFIKLKGYNETEFHSYSKEYTEKEIINDVQRFIQHKFFFTQNGSTLSTYKQS